MTDLLLLHHGAGDEVWRDFAQLSLRIALGADLNRLGLAASTM